MARTNIDSLMAAGVERIITSSAGCGSSMKEYAELLKDDPEYLAKAVRFSDMTDLTFAVALFAYETCCRNSHLQ
jgi:Fe-S oxidoreductase